MLIHCTCSCLYQKDGNCLLHDLRAQKSDQMNLDEAQPELTDSMDAQQTPTRCIYYRSASSPMMQEEATLQQIML